MTVGISFHGETVRGNPETAAVFLTVFGNVWNKMGR